MIFFLYMSTMLHNEAFVFLLYLLIVWKRIHFTVLFTDAAEQTLALLYRGALAFRKQ